MLLRIITPINKDKQDPLASVASQCRKKAIYILKETKW